MEDAVAVAGDVAEDEVLFAILAAGGVWQSTAEGGGAAANPRGWIEFEAVEGQRWGRCVGLIVAGGGGDVARRRRGGKRRRSGEKTKCCYRQEEIRPAQGDRLHVVVDGLKVQCPLS